MENTKINEPFSDDVKSSSLVGGVGSSSTLLISL